MVTLEQSCQLGHQRRAPLYPIALRLQPGSERDGACPACLAQVPPSIDASAASSSLGMLRKLPPQERDRCGGTHLLVQFEQYLHAVQNEAGYRAVSRIRQRAHQVERRELPCPPFPARQHGGKPRL